MNRIAVSFLLASILIQTSFSQNYEVRLLNDLSLRRTETQSKNLQLITDAADYVALGSIATQIGVGLLSKNKKVAEKGLLSSVALLGTYGVGYLLKKGINRPRPYETHPFINNYRIENDESFPSGSTAVAFSMATSLTVNYPKWYVAVPAYGFATAVGYSRMRLGAHYPTDVLAGAAIGAGSVWVTHKLNKWVRK
ncbi:MAG: membrane-associated phospholipid phosphatase [Spirosomataceae bacterium]|jgi:membrane-associated phospholipid phosphatase